MRIRNVVRKRAWALLWLVALGAVPVVASNNLVDHNGVVLTNPKLYIVYWGTDWQTGFTDGISGLPSTTYQAYLEGFLNSVGGGRWLGTQNQYRNAGAQPGALKGKWTDAINQLPATPTQGQLEDEVRRAVSHFNNESEYPQAVYLIALPPGHGDTAFAAKNGPACAWHSTAWNHNIIDVKFFPYITLPYMPDAPNGCYMNIANKGFDFSGHGVFDGVSKVAGHEWAEALTDPQMDAWYDNTGVGGETGDKCSSGPYTNLGAGGSYFAAQPLWSNNDGGCVMAGVPTKDQSPASWDFGPGIRYSTSSPLNLQAANNGDLDLPLDFINNSPWYLTGVNVNDFLLANNTCGKVLHPGESCQVTVTFRPLDFGTRQATLGLRVPFGITFTGNVTSLTGEGVPQWVLFDPNLVIVGDGVIIGSTARAPVKLTNTSEMPRLVQRVVIGGGNPTEFTILSDGCSDRRLEASASCVLIVGFTPRATGERRAELQVTEQSSRPFSMPMGGTGLGPVADISPSSLVFDDIFYDAGGVADAGGIPVSGEVLKDITITNVGQTMLQVQRLEMRSQDFALAATGCSQPLRPGEFCAIQVQLVPTHYQGQSGTLVISDNTSQSPHEVALGGEVEAANVGLVPDVMQFDAVPVGMASDPQLVKLENLEGEVALNIQAIDASGDFTVDASACPSSLVLGPCWIAVTFTPAAEGPRDGMLVITDDAPGSPRQIPLSGVGGPASGRTAR